MTILSKLLPLFFLIFTFNLYANESEVIELHENKSLDQLVLEGINNEIDNLEEKTKVEELESENNSPETEYVVEENIIEDENFWTNANPKEIRNYLGNSKNIKSDVLLSEFSNILLNINLDYSLKKNRDIHFLIVKYFYDIGRISSANSLIDSRDLEKDDNLNYYIMVKFNYLLTTLQLENVCSLKTEVASDVVLTNNLLEKIDIFCLLLNDKITEAELLNSILLETENENDKIFQILFQILSQKESNFDLNTIVDKKLNPDLIYLYSAMARIAEIPLTENFLEKDYANLAIPIILNNSSQIDLRIKAAHKSIENNTISIDSLAALYQSVDFDTSELNNTEKTIKKFSNNIEILMAYYFQRINIQIFPSERLQSLISFWDYAKKNQLEEIAYLITYNIVKSIEVNQENIIYAPEIAISYIYNQDFDNASKWLDFYENIYNENEQSIYARILLNIYSANEAERIIDLVISNLKILGDISERKNEELIFVLLDALNDDVEISLDNNFKNIYDERLMPSIFIIENIKLAIEQNDQNKFLVFSVISIQNKNWNQLHPDHLNLIISGYLQYNSQILIKDIILELFKDFKIL